MTVCLRCMHFFCSPEIGYRSVGHRPSAKWPIFRSPVVRHLAYATRAGRPRGGGLACSRDGVWHHHRSPPMQVQLPLPQACRLRLTGRKIRFFIY